MARIDPEPSAAARQPQNPRRPPGAPRSRPTPDDPAPQQQPAAHDDLPPAEQPPSGSRTGQPPPTKSSVFELAVLGSLAGAAMHGYELRQKLSATLGSLRVFSYGSLYPMLRRLEAASMVTAEVETTDPDAIPLTSKRSRVVYRLTADGKEHLAELLGDAGPQSWSDDGFEIHLAFFSRTSAEARVRILEGRRRRVEERRERLRFSLSKAAGRLDEYTEQLRRLGLESTDREVRWLSELINTEKSHPDRRDLPPAGHP